MASGDTRKRVLIIGAGAAGTVQRCDCSYPRATGVHHPAGLQSICTFAGALGVTEANQQ